MASPEAERGHGHGLQDLRRRQPLLRGGGRVPPVRRREGPQARAVGEDGQAPAPLVRGPQVHRGAQPDLQPHRPARGVPRPPQAARGRAIARPARHRPDVRRARAPDTGLPRPRAAPAGDGRAERGEHPHVPHPRPVRRAPHVRRRRHDVPGLPGLQPVARRPLGLQLSRGRIFAIPVIPMLDVDKACDRAGVGPGPGRQDHLPATRSPLRPVPCRPLLRPVLRPGQRGRDPVRLPRHRRPLPLRRHLRGDVLSAAGGGRQGYMANAAAGPAPRASARPWTPLTSLVLGSFFERFPNIKVAIVEMGCTWVPYLLHSPRPRRRPARPRTSRRSATSSTCAPPR